MPQPQTSSQAAPDFIPAATPDFIPAAAAKKDEPGFLDREIPLDSYKNATLSGVQSIGRGFRSAGRGLYNTVAHPIDTAEGMIDAVTDAPSQIKQIPGAIRDINQSRDPLGTYAKVGQETAGDAAPQLLTAAAMDKLGEGVKATAKAAAPIAKAARPVAARALRTVSDVVDPEVTGVFSPRLSHLQKVAGRAAKVLSKGAAAEEPAAALGKIPVAQAPSAPSAPISIRRGPGEIPPTMVRPRAFSARTAEPIPPRQGLILPPGPEATAAEAATASAPEASPTVTPAVARPSAAPSSRLEELLNDAVGGRELEPNTPLRQQLSRIGKPSAPAPKMRPISDLSQQIKDSVPASDAPKMAPLTNLSQQIKNSAVTLPEGFTPVESSALRGYKYNPEAREFEAITNNGQHYVHSDVSPEEAAKFESSDSKGTAWNQLRKGPGVTLTKKGPVGQVSPVKPGTLNTSEGVIAKSGAGMKPDAQPISDDLSAEWQRNNEFLKKTKKASRIAKAGD